MLPKFDMEKHLSLHRLCAGWSTKGTLRQDITCFLTAQELEEVGLQFQLLANSPVFGTCVGTFDECQMRIKTPPGPHDLDYVD